MVLQLRPPDCAQGGRVHRRGVPDVQRRLPSPTYASSRAATCACAANASTSTRANATCRANERLDAARHAALSCADSPASTGAHACATSADSVSHCGRLCSDRADRRSTSGGGGRHDPAVFGTAVRPGRTGHHRDGLDDGHVRRPTAARVGDLVTFATCVAPDSQPDGQDPAARRPTVIIGG